MSVLFIRRGKDGGVSKHTVSFSYPNTDRTELYSFVHVKLPEGEQASYYNKISSIEVRSGDVLRIYAVDEYGDLCEIYVNDVVVRDYENEEATPANQYYNYAVTKDVAISLMLRGTKATVNGVQGETYYHSRVYITEFDD